MEIILLAAGTAIFILSFFIPDKKAEISGQSRELARDEIAALVSKEMENVRGHVDDVVDEAVTYAMEKTERSLERLSNEKIMAVNEYSDTVLAEIHKNHEEAMFLYDMLNSKHANLKDTVSVVNKTVKKAEEAVTGLQRLAPEALAAGSAGSTGNATTAGNVAGTGNTVSTRNTGNVGNAMPPGNGVGTGTVMTGLQRLAPGKVNRPSEPAPKAAGAPQGKVREGTRPSEPPEGDVGTLRGEEDAPGRVSFLPETDPDGRNNNRRILDLYQQGRSKVAIARELGLGVGEVKLVIDLFLNQ